MENAKVFFQNTVRREHQSKTAKENNEETREGFGNKAGLHLEAFHVNRSFCKKFTLFCGQT